MATQAQKAEWCNADVRSIRNWEKKDPDFASAETQADCLAIMERHGWGRDPTKTKTQLQEEKLREEIALLKLKRAREEGATVLVADVRDFLAQMAGKHSQMIRAKVATELPMKIAGKEIVDVRRECEAATDEIGEIVNRGLLEWTPS